MISFITAQAYLGFFCQAGGVAFVWQAGCCYMLASVHLTAFYIPLDFPAFQQSTP